MGLHRGLNCGRHGSESKNIGCLGPVALLDLGHLSLQKHGTHKLANVNISRFA